MSSEMANLIPEESLSDILIKLKEKKLLPE
jgi:hypothetical protein